MPRSNKRNAKTRAVRKTQQTQIKSSKTDKEKPASYDDNIRHWESLKDDIPTTSKQVSQIQSKRADMGNFGIPVKKASSSCSITIIRKFDKFEKGEKEPSTQVSSKKKRKHINRLICFTDSDDDEPHIGLPTMRYVDVARAAMLGTDKAVQTQKSPTQLINMGLEEFPLLQPTKYPISEMTNQHFKRNNSDSSVTGSVANSHGSDISDITECFLMNDKKKDFDNIDEMEEDESVNTTDPCIDPSSSVFCGIDDISSTGSYWAEGSNETGSENETISCTEEGGGDANFSFSFETDCTPQNSTPQSSTFSQEWLASTVRSLALPFGVSVPSFNFLQPDINFSRFERQFDDPHYRRMEDRAIFALRLALNKSFFREGNYI